MRAGDALSGSLFSQDLADKQQIDKPPFYSQGVDDVWDLDLFLRLQMFQPCGIRVNGFVCTAGLLDTLTRMISSPRRSFVNP